MVELERPVQMSAGTPLRLQVIIDGNKGVAYVNGKVAMNFRAYDLPAGNWGFLPPAETQHSAIQPSHQDNTYCYFTSLIYIQGQGDLFIPNHRNI